MTREYQGDLTGNVVTARKPRPAHIGHVWIGVVAAASRTPVSTISTQFRPNPSAKYFVSVSRVKTRG